MRLHSGGGGGGGGGRCGFQSLLSWIRLLNSVGRAGEYMDDGVSILVVLDSAPQPRNGRPRLRARGGFNPCCPGFGSSTLAAQLPRGIGAAGFHSFSSCIPLPTPPPHLPLLPPLLFHSS